MHKNFFITTPIYYVNGKPHIGHAYTSIVSDFLARFYKIQGKKTFFLTGTDEHGQKVAQSAEKHGVSPQEFCDNISSVFKDLAQECNVQYDDFIRTTEERHKCFIRKIWDILEKNGWIYKGTYNGWYSVQDEAFYDESEIIEGKAPSGSSVNWREEESYFFKLSNFTEILSQWYESNSHFVFPVGRFNEVKSFVTQGLKDLSVSRSTFSWGVDIPNTKHIMYVWLDALFNYHSALDSEEKFTNFWKNSQVMHIIGKDILRFHAVYWPAFLTAIHCTPETISVKHINSACKNIQIVSHGWWLSEGQKMSKSLGNTVDPFALLKKYSTDYLRYFLLREAQFGSDGNFTQEGFHTRITSELINNIGNLCQRTFTLLHKNCEGIIPSCKPSHALLDTKIQSEMGKLLEEFKINQSLDVIINYSSKANEFIQEKKPWELFKQGKQSDGEETLYILLYAIYQIKEAIAPALPDFHKHISQVFSGQEFQSGIKLNTIIKVFEPLC
ncbi:MAG: methionyl-tRNA synthetase [Candidatus Deianiraeaceae bacterium]|jgi:methionyl-tRNA synthetase